MLLEGVERDLAPFRHRGITLQMVEHAYCVGTADVTSFRVQVLQIFSGMRHAKHFRDEDPLQRVRPCNTLCS